MRQTALRLFARHGFAAVSMRQIAAGVGVQVGALYSYTKDKETLLFDLLLGHMTELLAAWQDTPDRPALARLESFTRFHIAFSLDRPEAVFLSYMELRNLSPAHHGEIAALRRAYEDALEQILRAGEAEGVFVMDDSRLATMALIAMLTGVTTWYRDGGRLARDKVADVYWRLVRGAVMKGAAMKGDLSQDGFAPIVTP